MIFIHENLRISRLGATAGGWLGGSSGFSSRMSLIGAELVLLQHNAVHVCLRNHSRPVGAVSVLCERPVRDVGLVSVAVVVASCEWFFAPSVASVNAVVETGRQVVGGKRPHGLRVANKCVL